MKKLLKWMILPLVLMFYVRDKRIIADDLYSQRLPWGLGWADTDEDNMKYGLNGDIKHQSKQLLNYEGEELRPGLLANAVVMIYDREMEHQGNPVSWHKIYKMRLLWLTK